MENTAPIIAPGANEETVPATASPMIVELDDVATSGMTAASGNKGKYFVEVEDAVPHRPPHVLDPENGRSKTDDLNPHSCAFEYPETGAELGERLPPAAFP